MYKLYLKPKLIQLSGITAEADRGFFQSMYTKLFSKYVYKIYRYQTEPQNAVSKNRLNIFQNKNTNLETKKHVSLC